MGAPTPRMHGITHVHGGPDPAMIAWEATGGGSLSFPDTVFELAGIHTLLGYWRLNEGASPYADTSGHNPGDPATMVRTALSVPMAQAFTPAAVAEDTSAVAFNADGTAGGFGDYLSASTLAEASRFAFTGTAPFTVVAWVRPAAGAATSLGGVVDWFRVPSGVTHGWMLGVNQPAQTPHFRRLAGIATGGTPPTVTGPAISAGAWHLLAAVYNSTAMLLYIDGVLAGTVADTSGLSATGNPPQIGIGQDTSTTAQWFYGAVAEVSVWASALTAAEILSLYEAA